MELTVDVSETDLIEFGRDSVQKEIENTIRWMKIKRSFRIISEELKLSFDEQEYYDALEDIRASAWNEYSKNLVP
jgi:hypothetical protein